MNFSDKNSRYYRKSATIDVTMLIVCNICEYLCNDWKYRYWGNTNLRSEKGYKLSDKLSENSRLMSSAQSAALM